MRCFIRRKKKVTCKNPDQVLDTRKVCVRMKGKIVDVLKRSKKLRAGVVAAAVAVVIGSVGVYEIAQVPELPVYTADPVVEVTIEEEEVPLAAKSTTTTKTSKKSSTKKKTLKSKSKKTYTKKLPTTTKTSTKTTKSKTKTVKKQTTVKTSVKEKYYKNKKYKNVTTTKVTTVKTTTTPVAQKTASTSKATAAKYEANIEKLAPKMNANVIQAFTSLGFKVYVDGSVNYSGYFDAKNRTITLKKEDDTIYHELGHFVAFVSGNTDTTANFKNIYNAEKNNYTGTNKTYVIQSSSEYFAESVKDYILTPSTLKSARPKTYAAISDAMGKVTTAQANKLRLVYAAVWK